MSISLRAGILTPSPVKLNTRQRLHLGGLQVADLLATPFSPQGTKLFLKRMNILTGLGFNNAVLQALSALFGIDEGNDDKRMAAARKIIPHLTANPQILRKAIELLPSYKAWTASSAHRFMPLALAVVNMFEERDIFSPTPIPRLVHANPVFAYLGNEYQLLANPQDVPAEFVPTSHPSLVLPRPLPAPAFRWLDIGSAPKAAGAPTLIALKSALDSLLPGLNFEYYGSDIAVPYFGITPAGEIGFSHFVEATSGKIRGKTTIGGITYLDATLPQYDVTQAGFMAGETFDFISLCQILHHLKQGPFQEISLSSKNITDPAGNNMEEKLKIHFTPAQQGAVDRLLERLSIGGIMFINVTSLRPVPEFSLQYITENNFDMFFVVQRKSEHHYILYADHPIPFRPNDDLFAPHIGVQLVNGLDSGPAKIFYHPGVRSIYPQRPGKFYQEVSNLFARADILAYQYQGWKKGIWGTVLEVVDAIREKKPLPEIFKIYLKNVPDNHPLKQSILKEARKLAHSTQK